MNTLITGGGMIGSHAASLLIKNKINPILIELRPQQDSVNDVLGINNANIISGDVLDFNFLLETIRKYSIDSIVHTVANPFLNAGANDSPYEAIRLNIMGTANVLEAARKLDLGRVVFLSSATLETNLKPASEIGQMSEDNIPRTTNIYSSTKIACENLGLNYSDLYGTDFVSLRPVGVFGPWLGKGGGGRSNMMKNLIGNILHGREGHISPWVGEIVYVKDVALSILRALVSNSIKFRIYNVGMGEIYSPEQIINIFSKISPDSKIRVESGGDMVKFKPAILAERPMDLKRSRNELEYTPEYLMEEAILDYMKWYKSHI